MDRQIVYPSSIPLDTDILSTNKNAMLGVGFLAQDILGTATLASGLACTPTGPATMQVQLAAGRIYALENVDNSSYGSIAADTTHQVVKQGISLATVLLSCPAPSTSGFSINYLIEAAYADSDDTDIVLAYYNASNPSVPYSGQGNSGAPQATVRQGIVVLTAKPGIAATTGTQTTPSADSGNVGLWVVTVANGATTIVSGNIALAPSAPFVPGTLGQMLTAAAAAATYLTTAAAASTYETQAAAAATYLTNSIFSAANTWTALNTFEAGVTIATSGLAVLEFSSDSGAHLGYIGTTGVAGDISTDSVLGDTVVRSATHVRLNASNGGASTMVVSSTAITGFGATAGAQVDMTPDKGNWTANITGPAAGTVALKWERQGTQVTIWTDAGGLVTATVAAQIVLSGLPAAITPSSNRIVKCSALENNSVSPLDGSVTVNSAGTMNVFLSQVSTNSGPLGFVIIGGNFTGSGGCGLSPGWSITYSL